MENLELICKSANDKNVVFDPVNSHTSTHFKDAPTLRGLVTELLESMVLEGDLIAKDVDMGRVIGESDVVEVDDTDKLVFAMRNKREDQGYVPFTKSRSTQPSNLISLYAVQRNLDTYELLSAWIGAFECPSFPQMDNATADSIPYWSRHAFVWGSQEIIPGTELSECPW